MAKKELQWMPFLGQYMTASGAVFVNRSSNKDAIAALATAGEKMKSRGVSVSALRTRHLVSVSETNAVSSFIDVTLDVPRRYTPFRQRDKYAVLQKGSFPPGCPSWCPYYTCCLPKLLAFIS